MDANDKQTSFCWGIKLTYLLCFQTCPSHQWQSNRLFSLSRPWQILQTNFSYTRVTCSKVQRAGRNAPTAWWLITRAHGSLGTCSGANLLFLLLILSNTWTVQIAKFSEISHFFNQHESPLGRHVNMPTCSSPNLRQTLCHVLHTNHTHGGVT